MARGVESLSNIEGPSAAYPNGKIKDRAGSTPGTPVNEKAYGDLHQLLRKLLRLAGITPNNLPENETNGFQYIQALEHFVNPPVVWHYVGSPGEPELENSWVNDVSPLRFCKDRFGWVTIQGVIKNGEPLDSIFSLPNGYKPDREFYSCLCEAGVGSAKMHVPDSTTSGKVRVWHYINGGGNTLLTIDIKFKAA